MVQFQELELFQIALHTCFEMEHHGDKSVVVERWSTYCLVGVELGRKLYTNNVLKNLIDKKASIKDVYERIGEYNGN